MIPILYFSYCHAIFLNRHLYRSYSALSEFASTRTNRSYYSFIVPQSTCYAPGWLWTGSHLIQDYPNHHPKNFVSVWGNPRNENLNQTWGMMWGILHSAFISPHQSCRREKLPTINQFQAFFFCSRGCFSEPLSLQLHHYLPDLLIFFLGVIKCHSDKTISRFYSSVMSFDRLTKSIFRLHTTPWRRRLRYFLQIKFSFQFLH